MLTPSKTSSEKEIEIFPRTLALEARDTLFVKSTNVWHRLQWFLSTKSDKLQSRRPRTARDIIFYGLQPLAHLFNAVKFINVIATTSFSSTTCPPSARFLLFLKLNHICLSKTTVFSFCNYIIKLCESERPYVPWEKYEEYFQINKNFGERIKPLSHNLGLTTACHYIYLVLHSCDRFNVIFRDVTSIWVSQCWWCMREALVAWHLTCKNRSTCRKIYPTWNSQE